MSKTIHGSCLCGDVTYEVIGNIGLFQYCHCSRCRKLTGTAHASNLFVDPADFRYTSGEERVTRFDMEEAKYFAPCFCNRCGSTLPWMSKTGKVVIVPAGTLDEAPDIKPIQNIYWDSRADWHVETSELVKFAELPDRSKN